MVRWFLEGSWQIALQHLPGRGKIVSMEATESNTREIIERAKNQMVAKTFLPGLMVSTIDLLVTHMGSANFETLVFAYDGENIVNHQEFDGKRYVNREEAMAGHIEMVTKWADPNSNG